MTIMTRVKQKVITLVVAAGCWVWVTAKPSACGDGIKRTGRPDWCIGRAGSPVNGARRGPCGSGFLARYDQRYADFGPTLAAEYLGREDRLEVDHETLRRWLIAEGKRSSVGGGKGTGNGGTQAVPWADGATGRFAPRLV
jgi:hypothetical protein